uniref:Voltage-dependent T-type calcium channel subunit alpha n=1 Tax=Strigamia maritima TaxID=126957 RepID=T1JBM2_STRMM
MMVILLNCVTLGMYQPCTDEVCSTSRCKILQMFDDVIFTFFAVEMMIKMIAMGMWGKGAYLAETWNRLDCFIVMAGAIEYCLDMENMNLSAIRTIRVLRPLRAINRIPSMRILVMLLLDTLPMLGNVLLLCFFVFFIFGIVGVQLWAGLLRQRCFIHLPANVTYPENRIPPYYSETVKIVKPLSSYYKVYEAEKDYICSLPKDSGLHTCRVLPPMKQKAMICNATALPFSNNTPTNGSCVNWHQYYTKCRPGDKNPFQGAISFDNIGLAWVAIFLVISLEGWTDIMYYVQDAHSFWDWIYFVLLIVIGSFFMINLCLVVIATQFSETKKREMERMRMERARYQSTSTLASNSMSEPNSCYTEIIKYIAHLWRRARRKVMIHYRRVRKQPEKELPKTISLRRKKSRNRRRTKKDELPPVIQPKLSIAITEPSTGSIEQVSSSPVPSALIAVPPCTSPVAPRASPEVSDIDPLASPRHPQPFLGTNLLSKVAEPQSSHHLRVPTPTSRRSSQFTCQELLAIGGAQGAVLAASLATGYDIAKGEKHFSAPQLLFYPFSEGEACKRDRSPSGDWTDSEVGSDIYEWESDEDKEEKLFWKILKKIQEVIRSTVEHRYFQRGILVAILVNTFSMGIEYHNQPEELTSIVETSNVVFSAIFAIEMALKVIADGPYVYISNGFNVFDGVIVILSVVELLQDSEGSALSVLRTFRLLRILKLVRFMPALRRQLFVMIRTMDNVAVFFALLILFIFIFSILGMNLFGCKFCVKIDDVLTCDRKNFDSLLWAIVTVFQILTQEDWNIVLFNGMERTSHWAALYFVALMTFGNYVLFNLLVAILVEGFSAEDEKKRSDGSLSDNEEKNKQLQEREEKDRADAKLKQLQEDYDPKCNITKETKLLHLPPSLAVSRLEKEEIKSGDAGPPIITHTAATPQGSPNATLEPLARDLGFKLSPLSALTASYSSIDSIDRSTSSVTSIPHLLQMPSNGFASGMTSQRMNIQSSKATRKDSLTASPRLQRKGSNSSTGTSPWLNRKGSKTSSCSWRRRSRKKGSERENLVDSDQDSQPELNDDMMLNNALNNRQTPNQLLDRSQCNGAPPTLYNRRNILTQQNPIGSPTCTLSPQNSIRSHSSASAHWGNAPPCSPSSHTLQAGGGFVKTQSPRNSIYDHHSSRHFSIASSFKDDYKANNLIVDLPAVKTGLDADDGPKICWFFEPSECLINRSSYSLYIFEPENKFRKICSNLMEQKWFDYGTLAFIGLNCVTLAMERPNIPPSSKERLFLTITNYVFTVVFALEMLVKVVGSGLWYGKHTYFRSGWNVMDGTLVIISLVDVIMNFFSTSSSRIFGILRVFRLLRSLRPLRVINRAPGLKLVVQTLLSSLRPIGNIVLICCTFFIIFGILGVQLFKGTFYYCEGPEMKGIKNRTDCESDSRNEWLNRRYNFDDLGQALMALFVLSSKDGWVDIMYQGLDAVGVDQQPIENYSEWRLLYFISFLLLVGFFVLNMFVGVVVENFHRCREEQEKEEKARRAEKRARKLEKKRRRMREPPYYSTYSRPRLFIHNTVTSKYFDLAIAAVIGLNVVTMAMEFYMMPGELVYALKIFNYFFTAVFILEAAMKVVALGFKLYLKDRQVFRPFLPNSISIKFFDAVWNQLDVAIVILSVVGIVLEEMENEVIPINPTIIRVMRVLRIARVLKLLKMAKGIRALLDTVMQALPQVGNLGLLFYLLFFIFAALGVELFGRLECDENHPCQGLGEHAHFANFGMAFLTLFRVATGDNWNGIMKDTLRDNCDASSDCVRNCCVSAIITPLYFVVFVLMAQFVLVNVVVAVLMKHLEESHKQMDDDLEMDDEIEMELAAEEEELAAIQEASKAQEARKVDTVRVASLHKPVVKMSSLPANFTFNFYNVANNQDNQGSPPASPKLMDDNKLQNVYKPASRNSDNSSNINLRQASPEDKVAVADLSIMSPSVITTFLDGNINMLTPSELDPSPVEEESVVPPPYPAMNEDQDPPDNFDRFPSIEDITEEEEWGALPPSPCSWRPDDQSQASAKNVSLEESSESITSSSFLGLNKNDSLRINGQLLWSSLSSDSTEDTDSGSGIGLIPLDVTRTRRQDGSTDTLQGGNMDDEDEPDDDQVLIVDPQNFTFMLVNQVDADKSSCHDLSQSNESL